MSADTTFANLGVPAALTTALEPRHHQPLPDPGRHAAATRWPAATSWAAAAPAPARPTRFLLPVLTRLSASPTPPGGPSRPRGLILVPTRELATQIDAALAPLAKRAELRSLTVFGGVGANPQISGLRAGVDVLVACPGRLTDLIQEGHADLGAVEITVLDEADHMADLGFLPGVRRLMDRTPRDGQRLLFSATLDAGVDVLVKRFLTNPVTHSVDSAQSPVPTWPTTCCR